MKLQEAIGAAMAAANENKHTMDVYLVLETGEFVVNDDYAEPDNTSRRTHRHMGIAFPEQTMHAFDVNGVSVGEPVVIPAGFTYDGE